MELDHRQWGRGELISISDPESKFHVELTNFGASIVRVSLPDKHGAVGNITFGQNSPADYRSIGGHMGATVGRVANRIRGGRFELGGKAYQLAQNNAGQHCLHGGNEGFSLKFWDIIETAPHPKKNSVRVTFEYASPDGEEHFPGKLTARATYLISPMKLQWEYFAFADRPTLINMTNHAYWNLEALDQTIDDHILTLGVDRFNEIDESCLPSGKITPLEGTPLDFRKSLMLADVFEDFGDVDHNFWIAGYGEKPHPFDLLYLGELSAPASGRAMKIWTSEPCVQVYTGNFMGRLSAFGRPCRKHNAICLETQRMPDAVNYPEFRDQVILRPRLVYSHRTLHKFTVR